jgi:hypothetical protein
VSEDKLKFPIKGELRIVISKGFNGDIEGRDLTEDTDSEAAICEGWMTYLFKSELLSEQVDDGEEFRIEYTIRRAKKRKRKLPKHLFKSR